jgi:hypothetical protein
MACRSARPARSRSQYNPLLEQALVRTDCSKPVAVTPESGMLCLRSGGLGIVARLYDPEATEKARALMPQVEMPDSAYEAAKDAEALVIATEWNEFQDLDWVRIRDSMTRPLVLDARNLLNRREMKALGFEYYSVGRPE